MQTIIIDGKTKYLKEIINMSFIPNDIFIVIHGAYYSLEDNPPYLFISYDGKEVSIGDVVFYVDETSLCNGKYTINKNHRDF